MSRSRHPLWNQMHAFAEELDSLVFSAPVTHWYNPLSYAWDGFEKYLALVPRHAKVVLVGMNPGPYGMMQTGVPFGEIDTVRHWLGIDARIGRPPREHPRRPVVGMALTRREASGQRIWGLARSHYERPSQFFKDFYLTNFCPLVFFDEAGRNLTPDKLRKGDRDKLFPLCRGNLRSVIETLRPELVIGIGKFAWERSVEACAGLDVRIGRIIHPSPANPLANRGWEASVLAELGSHGVELGCNQSPCAKHD